MTNYKVGWNMISFTEGSTEIRFRSSVNFGSLVVKNTTATLSYTEQEDIIIGSRRSGSTIYGTFMGIIHTIWIKDYDMSEAELGNYIVPRTGCTKKCDYYVGMYKDLTAKNSSDDEQNYIDVLEGGFIFDFKGDDKNVFTTDGLDISAGKIELKDRVYEEWAGVTYQFWFKGTITDNKEFARIYGGSDDKQAYLMRSGTNILLKSIESSNSVTFTGAYNSSNSNWAYYALSIGWLGDDDYKDHSI